MQHTNSLMLLGYMIPPSEAELASGASNAGNKMQWNIAKNLVESENVKVVAVSVYPLASFPHDNRIIYRKHIIHVEDNFDIICPSFCNIPLLKQVTQIIGVYCTAVRLLKDTPELSLLCYNLFPQIGIPIRGLKKRFPNLNAVCLLADLPIDDKTNRNGLSKWFRAVFDSSTRKSISLCDRFVVLNKHVADSFLRNKPYIVIEGGVSKEDLEKAGMIHNKGYKKNILFCGALNEYNGIINLIAAMDELRDTDIVLDVYGGGYLEEEVRRASKRNCNIRFHGKVDNQTVMQKQREAWLLVNPRPVDDPISMVTFPSKTFEYLLSGTPVASTKLNGYGEEYLDKMFFFENDSPTGIAKTIRDIAQIEDSELKSVAERARQFVIKEKNWEKQTHRIKTFVFGKEEEE